MRAPNDRPGRGPRPPTTDIPRERAKPDRENPAGDLERVRELPNRQGRTLGGGRLKRLTANGVAKMAVPAAPPRRPFVAEVPVPHAAVPFVYLRPRPRFVPGRRRRGVRREEPRRRPRHGPEDL